jgi:hypothetical protein
MMGGAARHEEEVRAGRARFRSARAAYAQRERGRRAGLAQLQSDNHRRAGEVTALNSCAPAGTSVLDAGTLTALISWRTGHHDLDASALLLDARDASRSDRDFIFYNQPTTPDGSIGHNGKAPRRQPPPTRSASRSTPYRPTSSAS